MNAPECARRHRVRSAFTQKVRVFVKAKVCVHKDF